MMDSKWFDRWGLIKSRVGNDDGGNGILYLVIASCLGLMIGYEIKRQILNCIDQSSCLLSRTPYKTYGIESHDDYLAVAIIHLWGQDCIYPRAIILTAILNLSYLKNCAFDFNNKTFFEKVSEICKPITIRFPIVWLVMFAAAFQNKVVKFLMRTILSKFFLFQKMNLSDASGIQLQWLQRYAMILMGDKKPMIQFLKRIQNGGSSMSLIMSQYYDAGHPILSGYDAFTKEILK